MGEVEPLQTNRIPLCLGEPGNLIYRPDNLFHIILSVIPLTSTGSYEVNDLTLSSEYYPPTEVNRGCLSLPEAKCIICLITQGMCRSSPAISLSRRQSDRQEPEVIYNGEVNRAPDK